VQSLHIQKNLAGQSDGYADFAAGFSIFNLQVAPPRAFQDFWKSWWTWEHFKDDEAESEVLRDQLFYLLWGFLVLVVAHQLTLWALQVAKFPIPGFLKFPQVEIVGFMAVCMGFLDSSAGVLSNVKTAWGWKALAVVELSTVAAFLMFMLGNALEFRKKVYWEPQDNVKLIGRGKVVVALDEDDQGKLTLLQLLSARKKLGLSEDQVKTMFSNLTNEKTVMGVEIRLKNSVGVKEFADLYSQQRIAFQRATFVEGMYALVYESRREAGKWFASDPLDDVNEPFGRFFTKFTPRHKLFYLENIAKNVAEVFILNSLVSFGELQVTLMLALNCRLFVMVVKDSPYVLLAQSRSEIITVVGRFLVYLTAWFAVLGALDDRAAAGIMTALHLTMLVSNIYGQLYPAAKGLWPFVKLWATRLLFTLYIFFCVAVVGGEIAVARARETRAGQAIVSVHIRARSAWKSSRLGTQLRKAHTSFSKWMRTVAASASSTVSVALMKMRTSPLVDKARNTPPGKAAVKCTVQAYSAAVSLFAFCTVAFSKRRDAVISAATNVKAFAVHVKKWSMIFAAKFAELIQKLSEEAMSASNRAFGKALIPKTPNSALSEPGAEVKAKAMPEPEHSESGNEGTAKEWYAFKSPVKVPPNLLGRGTSLDDVMSVKSFLPVSPTQAGDVGNLGGLSPAALCEAPLSTTPSVGDETPSTSTEKKKTAAIAPLRSKKARVYKVKTPTRAPGSEDRSRNPWAGAGRFKPKEAELLNLDGKSLGSGMKKVLL